MLNYEELLNKEPYSLDKKEKEKFLFKNLSELTQFHQNNCEIYRKITEKIYNNKTYKQVSDIPFIPVRLFKEYELKSISDEALFKIRAKSFKNIFRQTNCIKSAKNTCKNSI